MTFHYASFRAEYVRLLHMTSYQRCLYHAEKAKAAQPRWTDNRLRWVEWQGSEGHFNRPTESAALEGIAREVGRFLKRTSEDKIEFVQLLREVFAEDRRQRRATMPLRELLARRGRTLGFLDMGGGKRLWTELPLSRRG